MKKILGLLIAVIVMTFGFMSLIAAHPAQAAGDCDGNAVIYCGVSSLSDLTKKVTKGTGKSHQSGKELTALFAKYHAYPSEFSKLKKGRVTKTNKVYVGDKVVATNVYTMGRHNFGKSTKISGLSYPLYKRHPSVSFLSDSLDAYVYLNYDGTMRYAIIKSCGNIVIGVVHNKPTPPPVVVPGKVNLIVKKFEDVNGNKNFDAEEGTLSGWEFKIVGPGFNRTVTTLPDGTVSLAGLNPGTYTVTEVLQSGWRNTTGVSIVRNVTTNVNTQTFLFGNQQIEIPVTPETPVVTPTGGGEVTTLPVTGTKEWVMAGLVMVLLASGLWWVRSKDMLRNAKRRKPTGSTTKKKTVKRRK